MGDSYGEPRTFEHVHDDINAAIEHFLSVVPGLQQLVLWGLCDGASASLAHAALDRRVTGLVLLNPWVRTEAGIAGAYLRRYYFRRFFDPDFWSKVRRFELDVVASVASAVRLMRAALGVQSTGAAAGTEGATADGVDSPQPLPVRMLADLRRYAGRVLVILSGDDLTAEEFRRTTVKSRAWRRELAKPRVTRQQLSPANHTFSREVWREQVASWTVEWVRSL
jgi:exosortase A-associated hydrolase 1